MEHPQLGTLTWNEEAYLWSGAIQGPHGQVPLSVALEEQGPIPEEQLEWLPVFLSQETPLRFAIARDMLELANVWREVRQEAALTAEELAQLMRLGELAIEEDGDLNAFYHAGGVFEEHRIIGVFNPVIGLIDTDLVG